MSAIISVEQPRAKRRFYSDHDRANTLLALDANEGNLSATARTTGIPLTTIKGWRDSPQPHIAELRNGKKPDLAELFHTLAFKSAGILDHRLSQRDSKDIPIPHLTALAGVATEKWLLLTGQETSRPGISEAERELRTAELFLKYCSPQERPDPNI